MPVENHNLDSARDTGHDKFAGVVLCGGKSSRMGRAKADLPFGSESMLQRVVRILSQVVNHIVVVAAAEQSMPSFESETIRCAVTVARDSQQFAGPLAGLGVGLRELEARQEFLAAYVTSCDVPFLQPSFVETLFQQVTDYDVVVPFDDRHLHPISAVYRPSVVRQVDQLIADGERRPRAIFDLVRTLRVPTASLESVDPGLLTLLNLNSPADYKSALAQAGLAIPDWLDVDGATNKTQQG